LLAEIGLFLDRVELFLDRVELFLDRVELLLDGVGLLPAIRRRSRRKNRSPHLQMGVSIRAIS
jgi:hypothetical protein